jgi:hypothetical protein
MFVGLALGGNSIRNRSIGKFSKSYVGRSNLILGAIGGRITFLARIKSDIKLLKVLLHSMLFCRRDDIVPSNWETSVTEESLALEDLAPAGGLEEDDSTAGDASKAALVTTTTGPEPWSVEETGVTSGAASEGGTSMLAALPVADFEIALEEGSSGPLLLSEAEDLEVPRADVKRVADNLKKEQVIQFSSKSEDDKR